MNENIISWMIVLQNNNKKIKCVMYCFLFDDNITQIIKDSKLSFYVIKILNKFKYWMQLIIFCILIRTSIETDSLFVILDIIKWKYAEKILKNKYI